MSPHAETLRKVETLISESSQEEERLVFEDVKDRLVTATKRTYSVLILPGVAYKSAHLPALDELLQKGVRVYCYWESRPSLTPTSGVVHLYVDDDGCTRRYPDGEEQSWPESLFFNEGVRLGRVMIASDSSESRLLSLLERAQSQLKPMQSLGGDPQLSRSVPLKVQGVPEAKLGETCQQQGGSRGTWDWTPLVCESDDDLVSRLLPSYRFERSICVAETAVRIKSGSVRRDFDGLKAKAAENEAIAQDKLRSLLGALGHFNPNEALRALDQTTGAVRLSAAEWRRIEEWSVQQEPVVAGAWLELTRFFREKLARFYREDMPCWLRVLEAPEEILLRGEQYYYNMANESPFLRIQRIWMEGEVVSRLLTEAVWQPPEKPDILVDVRDASHGQEDRTLKWKLLLAVLDQLRNVSLLSYSFLQAARYDSRFALRSSDIDIQLGSAHRGAAGVLHLSVSMYYSVFLFDCNQFRKDLEEFRKLSSHFHTLSQDWSKSIDGFRGQSFGNLLRRWREADNPLDNLLTSILAIGALGSKLVSEHGPSSAVLAAGIGWGGIEIPLVFRRLLAGYGTELTVGACEEQPPSIPVYIAQFSHYRGQDYPHEGLSFPDSEVSDPLIGRLIVLFDDNVLTGITLERVRDWMYSRGAADVRLFVTRYSGERRHAHMMMLDHGAIDPDLLSDGTVGGFVGETFFSRSWSTTPKSYKSPIGIFSLSKRRVLECLHNNAMVNLFDREGF